MTFETVNRWCYRCTDCLSVVFCSELVRGAHCAACGGETVENMGRVERNRLVRDSFACPCDARCTGALGPDCTCHCGGANHGSGRLVPVVCDAGAIPRIQIIPTSKALAIAAEWRAALSGALAEWKRYQHRRDCREWLSAEDFERHARIGYVIRAARKLRTHVARMKAIRTIIDSESVGVA